MHEWQCKCFEVTLLFLVTNEGIHNSTNKSHNKELVLINPKCDWYKTISFVRQ